MPQKNNPFSNALEENENIQGHLRDIIHDVFSNMYYGLGKMKFLRWINEKFPDRIKELMVKEFDKEDKEEHPTWGGYYTEGTNEIKLRNLHDRSTASHEGLHFITDEFFNGNLFPTFINEGITEYINRELEKINNGGEQVVYSYPQNVDFVEFLHKIMGDSLIKAYFTGSSKQFEREFSTYITYSGQEDIYILNQFYNLLGKVHNYLHPREEIYDEKKEDMKRDIEENVYPNLKVFIRNIITNSIRKKAHDLDYYKDGKIDCLALKKDIMGTKEMALNLLRLHGTFNITRKLDEESYEFEKSIIRDSLIAALEEIRYEEKGAMNIAKQCIKGGTIEINRFGNLQGNPPTINAEQLDSYLNNIDLNNIVSQLMQIRLRKVHNYMQDGIFDINEFLMDASLVLDKLGVKNKSRQMIMDSVILRCAPANADLKFIKDIIDRNQNLYVALYKKKQEATRNVTENRFVKIENNLFVEKRDDAFYLLHFDETRGEFIEKRIYPQHIDLNMRFSKEQKEKFGESVRRITFEERSNQKTKTYSLYFDKDFRNVAVNGEDLNVMQGVNGLADSYLIDEAMQEVISGVMRNEYVTFLQDGEKRIDGVQYTQDIDDRTRIINFRAFAEELKNTVSRLPKQYHEQVTKLAILWLIKWTYGRFEYDITQISQLITRNEFLSGEISEDIKLELLEITEELNERRREEVKERRKICGVHFPDMKTKERYYENVRNKQRRKETRALNKKVKEFVLEYAGSCIEEPLEVRSDEEHFSTIAGVKYTDKSQAFFRTAAAKTVNYELLAYYIKENIGEIPKENRARYIRKVLDEAMWIWYGYGDKYPGCEDISNKRDRATAVIQAYLSNHLIHNKKLNLNSIRQAEAFLLKLSRKEEKICNELLGIRQPIGYADEATKDAYNHLKSIHDGNKYTREEKKAVIAELKGMHKKGLEKRTKMSNFARIALAGRPPSLYDIKMATEILGVKENELGE